MRKHRAVIDRQAVIEALRRGERPEQIAKELDYAVITVQKIQQENGLSFIRKQKRYDAIVNYRMEHHSVDETAEHFGVSTGVVYMACRGKSFSPVYHEKPCAFCGKPTKRIRYCSDICERRAHYASRSALRRARLQAQIVDRDITLKKLFERDGGVCWICGMMCDWNDTAKKDNYTLTGKLFPTVDHVKPLSKGGKHSWENVRLAHNICNILKSDHPLGVEEK